jgi:hypothetical protein
VAAHRGFFALASDHGLLGGPTATARQVIGDRKLSHIERFRAALRALVVEGQREGALRPMDRTLLVRFLGATFKVLAYEGIEGSSVEPSVAAKTLVTLFLHGAGRAARPTKQRRADGSH